MKIPSLLQSTNQQTDYFHYMNNQTKLIWNIHWNLFFFILKQDAVIGYKPSHVFFQTKSNNEWFLSQLFVLYQITFLKEKRILSNTSEVLLKSFSNFPTITRDLNKSCPSWCCICGMGVCCDFLDFIELKQHQAVCCIIMNW